MRRRQPHKDLKDECPLEVMEYKGLEAGTWLVVFKEKTGEPAIGSGGGWEVGERGRSQVAL